MLFDMSMVKLVVGVSNDREYYLLS